MKPLVVAFHVVTLALLLWIIFRLDSIQRSLAKMSVQLEVIQEQVDGIARDVVLIKREAQ